MILDERDILVVGVCLRALQQVASGVPISKLKMVQERGPNSIRVQATNDQVHNLLNGILSIRPEDEGLEHIGGTIWVYNWEYHIRATSKGGAIVQFECVYAR